MMIILEYQKESSVKKIIIYLYYIEIFYRFNTSIKMQISLSPTVFQLSIPFKGSLNLSLEI